MNKIVVILPALALLSACGAADGELKEGNWKNTMTMTKFEIPGAPAAMAQQTKSVLGKKQSTEICLNAAQAKAGVREFSSAMQQGDCKMENYKQGGGTMSGTMVCKGSAMGDTALKMDGTYTQEKVAMTLSGDISQKSLPGGKATMGMSVTSERVGDCKVDADEQRR